MRNKEVRMQSRGRVNYKGIYAHYLYKISTLELGSPTWELNFILLALTHKCYILYTVLLIICIVIISKEPLYNISFKKLHTWHNLWGFDRLGQIWNTNEKISNTRKLKILGRGKSFERLGLEIWNSNEKNFKYKKIKILCKPMNVSNQVCHFL